MTGDKDWGGGRCESGRRDESVDDGRYLDDQREIGKLGKEDDIQTEPTSTTVLSTIPITSVARVKVAISAANSWARKK